MVNITTKKSVGTIPQSGDIIQYAYSLYIYIKALILEQLPCYFTSEVIEALMTFRYYCIIVTPSCVDSSGWWLS